MLHKRKFSRPHAPPSREIATTILMETDDSQNIIESGSIEMQVKGKAV